MELRLSKEEYDNVYVAIEERVENLREVLRVANACKMECCSKIFAKEIRELRNVLVKMDNISEVKVI